LRIINNPKKIAAEAKIRINALPGVQAWICKKAGNIRHIPVRLFPA
jgi:hypothetical protein